MSEKETRWEMPAGTLMETCQIYYTHAEDNSTPFSQQGHICQSFPQKHMGEKHMSHKTQLDEHKML